MSRIEKNKMNTILIIIAVYLLFYYIIKKRKFSITDIIEGNIGLSKKDYYDYVLRREGGTSSDLNDSASENPMPNSDIHTNKGIQWITYVNYCEVNNRNVSETEFLLMPYDVWADISDSLYYNRWDMQRLKCRNLRFLIHKISWGSGVLGAERILANYFRDVRGIEDTNITKAEIITHFNELYEGGEKCNDIINSVIDYRLEYLQSLSNWDYYGNGWTNTYNELRDLLT